MAYTPKFGRLPKDDEPINSASDEADRSIHEVERDNEQYYLEQKKIAENVTRIQSGVRAGAAEALKRKTGGSENVEILANEKIQNELYKAVEGNEVYEHEKGDNKNWEQSLSAEYMKSGTLGKMKLKGKRFIRGVFAPLGADSLVQSRVEERFGPQFVEKELIKDKIKYQTSEPKKIEDRKEHVLGRLNKFLNSVDAKDLLKFARLFEPRLNKTLDLDIEEIRKDIIELIFSKLRRYKSEQLKEFYKNFSNQDVKENAVFIGKLIASEEFKDLVLISDLEQREKAKVGVEGVYDAEKLHDFYNEIKHAGEVIETNPKEDYKKLKKNAVMEMNKIFSIPEVDGLISIPESLIALKPFLLNLDEKRLKYISSQLGLKVENISGELNKESLVEKIAITLLQYKNNHLDSFIHTIIAIKKAINLPDANSFIDGMLKQIVKNSDLSRIENEVLSELGQNVKLKNFKLGDLEVFQKLILMKELEKSESLKINNPVVEVAKIFDEIIKNHSMWPLKDHPDGLALMAQMKFRLRTIKPKLENDKAAELHLAAYAYVAANSPNLEGKKLEYAVQETFLEFAKAATFAEELKTIGKEAPKKTVESEEKKREEINEIQKEILKIRKNAEASYINLQSIYKRKIEAAESAAIAESIFRNAADNKTKNPEANYIKETEAKKEAERDYRDALKDLHSLESEFMEKIVKLKISLDEISSGSSKEIPLIQDMLSFKKTSREDIENGLRMPADIDKELKKAYEEMKNAEEIKAIDIGKIIKEKIKALEEEKKMVGKKFYTLIKDKEEQTWVDFQSKVDDIQGEISKLTPFQLLQKMLRREYLEKRNPEHNPAHFHERAARYSLLTAAMRVQDVKNIDLHRNVNKKVAEHLKQWKIQKMYGKVASGLNIAGRKAGIELIEGDKETANSLIEQIIQSDEAKFGVFKGINKYTTPRDLRKILYESGKEVSLETMEEFIAILENILEGVKRGDDKYLKTLMHGDWDLENLILTLQKFKLERWTQQYMDKVIASEGNREHALLDLLRDRREEDEKISKEIHENVKSPDAMWKRQLSKNAIKDSLNEKILNSNAQIKDAGIQNSKIEIGNLENDIKDLEDGNPRKVAGMRRIEELKRGIARTERELTQSKDLYDKVQAFKETLEKNNLSRKEAKNLAASMGLSQIYDKMGMNFRLERYWKKIKSGFKKSAEWSWDKTKKAWNWTNGKFFNRETARKSFSLARKGATPITYPLGLAWKAGTFPVRLAGRAMAGAASLPGSIWRFVYSPSMKRYLRDFPIDINFKKEKLEKEKADLQEDLAKAPYDWDKKRILKKINRVDEKIEDLNEEMSRAKEKATKLGLTI